VNARKYGDGNAYSDLIMTEADVPLKSLAAKQPDALLSVHCDETETCVVLRNGALNVAIEKSSGRVIKFEFVHVNMFGERRDKVSGGYWSFAPTIAMRNAEFSVIDDPGKNAGARCVISCKLKYTGSDALPLDVDIRYALLKGESVLYCWAELLHVPQYPRLILTLGRFALKLDPEKFDYLAVDANRHGLMPSSSDWLNGEELNLKEARLLRTGRFAGKVEHKYDYSAVLFDTPAYGWVDTRACRGIWIINPSHEYITGGPTKVELTGHLGTGNVARPTLVNVWHGPHYGGEPIRVDNGEFWQKVIGPFQVYCNFGGAPETLWSDARRQADALSNGWPFSWAVSSAYMGPEQRGSVTGRLAIRDGINICYAANLKVGLTSKEYTVRSEKNGKEFIHDWQLDGKDYQYWQNAEASGQFVIPDIRPGIYEFRAIADNVLGEFTLSSVVVREGAQIDLGEIIWTPTRFGYQVWEIGFPNRTANKFRHGDHYWQWGLYKKYAQEFPKDVVYRIESRDWRMGWNYVQPARIENGRVVPTIWKIVFQLDSITEKGKAFLRLAIAGARAKRGLLVTVNDQKVRGTGPLRDSGVMHRDGIRGHWCERVIRFNVSRLRKGENIIALNLQPRGWTDGVLYDYLRLEILPDSDSPNDCMKRGCETFT
jgi:rhamnogalacturonan endolyase